MKLVVDKESLVSVADAIREKGGTSESLEFPQGFVDGINAIESGGGTPEVVTFTTSTNNATTTTAAFRSLVDNEKDIVAFRFIGDKNTWVQNQCVYTVVTKVNAVGLLRYRGAVLTECLLGPNYDAVVNVGDKYEKMKVGELW